MIHRICYLWTQSYSVAPPTSLRSIKEDRKIRISAWFILLSLHLYKSKFAIVKKTKDQ